MIIEILKAFSLIFIAEMGDKTQILAMAFATKYPVKKVILGILIGSFLNHGLAVILGTYISTYFPISTIQIIAGFAFIFFALITLKSDEESEDDNTSNKFGPVITVALAFFIGELGDKTQLTAITLASTAKYPLLILFGTVLGMIATGGIGIFVGRKIGSRIPEFKIKLIATSVFMFFGTLKLYQNLPAVLITELSVIAYFVVLIFIAYLILRPQLMRRKAGGQSQLIKTSNELYEHFQKINIDIQNICLGEISCGKCLGDNCIIGYTKELVKSGIQLESNDNIVKKDLGKLVIKEYDKDQVSKSLNSINEFLDNTAYVEELDNVLLIKDNLEKIVSYREVKIL